MASPQDTAEKIADVLRLTVQRATIQGPAENGYVNVMIQSADGVALQRKVRAGYVSTQMQQGTAVFIGYDVERELSIVGIDWRGQIEVGLNPAANNAADRYFYGATLQDSIQTLQCHPLANDSMMVVVRPWFPVRDGIWYELPEQRVDLTAYVPSAGNHVLIAIWVKTDNTIEVTSATEQALLDKLDLTDVQECQDASSQDASPVRFWRLYGGQTGVIETDSWRDARQVVNISESLTVQDEAEGVVVPHVHKLVFTTGAVFDLGSGEVFVGGGGGYYDYDPYAFHSNMSYEIFNLTEKVTPYEADLILIEDSEDSFNKKKVLFANLGAGGGGAPVDAKYITQTPDATLTNEQALSSLATGLLRSTTGTGVLSIATPGTHYTTPTGLESLSNKLISTSTLTTPTIASFTNAQHNHQNAAGGGTLDAAAIAAGTLNNARVNFASPADIGTTAPAKGHFTELQAISTTLASVPAPVMTVAQRDAVSSPTEGMRVYCSDTDELSFYDGQRWRAVESVGWTPYAFPLSFNPQGVFTTATTLTAQYASLAIPMVVQSHMLLESVSLRNTDIINSRTWGWNLYKQYLNNGNAGENTLTQVAASSANENFTPVAASTRTITAGSTPVYLAPGVYWLVIQNRDATNAFSVGGDIASTQFAHNTGQTKDTGSSNSTTLDFVAATWAAVTAIIAARLNGRVFGQTAAF